MRLAALLLALAAAPAIAGHYDPLAGLKPAGAPVDCVQTRLYDRTDIVPPSTIVFSDGLGRAFVNTLDSACPGVRRDAAFATRTPIDQLCRGDIADFFDPVGHIPLGSCALGPFTPYAR